MGRVSVCGGVFLVGCGGEEFGGGVGGSGMVGLVVVGGGGGY